MAYKSGGRESPPYSDYKDHRAASNMSGQERRYDGAYSSGYDEYPSASKLERNVNGTYTNGYQPPPPPDAAPAQPIADAVNSAFDNSSAANHLPADVIAQITQQVRTQVIDSLRAELAVGQPPPTPQSSYPSSAPQGINIPKPSGLSQQFHAGSHPSGISGASAPPPPDSFYASSSPPSNIPIRDIRTPPTPDRDSDDSSYYTRTGRSKRTSYHQSSGDMHPPPATRRRSQGSPRRGSGLKEDIGSRYGERAPDNNRPQAAERPSVPRQKTDEEETVVEKMWQPLFDADGQPTTRMNQFLRGIALHINDDFEPRNTLVVSPRKMRKYFETIKTTDEVISWKDLFDLPSAHLSTLYSNLGCSHHLVPRNSFPTECPTLPALTPHGFATFMAVFIKAYPEIEFQRLASTVRDWPICNADETKERWPKELSRRLFPRFGSDSERRRLDEALRKAGLPTPMSSFPPPPTTQPPGSAPPVAHSASASSAFPPPPPPTSKTPVHGAPPNTNNYTSSRAQRTSFAPPPSSQTAPASQPPPSRPPQPSVEDEVFSDDTQSSDDSRPSIPIERERKPYVAKEGSGKIHEQDLYRTRSNPAPPPPNLNSSFPPPPAQLSSSRDRAGSSSTASSVPSISTAVPPPPPSSATPRVRERTGSIASSYPSGTKRVSMQSSGSGVPASTRGRSPPSYTTATSRSDVYDGAYADEAASSERWYAEREREIRERDIRERERYERERERERMERDVALDRERGYAKYAGADEDGRYAARTPGGGGYNPPLGTGERRY